MNNELQEKYVNLEEAIANFVEQTETFFKSLDEYEDDVAVQYAESAAKLFGDMEIRLKTNLK